MNMNVLNEYVVEAVVIVVVTIVFVELWSSRVLRSAKKQLAKMSQAVG